MLSKKNLNKVWQIYGVGIVAYAILGSLALYFMADTAVSFSVNYWTNNDLASQTTTIFAPASNILWIIQYRYLIVVFLIICLIVPAIYVNQILSNKKRIDLRNLRWIDWMVTSSFMLAIIVLASSLQDIMAIVLVIGLNVLAYLLYWQSIHELKANRRLAQNLLKLEIVSLLLPWLLIFVYAISTWVYGGVRSPWYLYALMAVGAANSAAIIYDYFWHQRQIGKEKLLSTEAYPIVINQVIKVAFCLVLILGLWK